MYFSTARFCHLFIKQWTEHKKNYLLGIVSIPFILLTIYLFFPITNSLLTHEVQNMTFSFGLFIIGGIFNSTLLTVYATKPLATRALMIPVSALERLLVALAYGIVLFPIIYCLLGYPMILLAHKIDTDVFGNLNKLAIIRPRYVVILIWVFIIAQSFTLLCSLFFKKLVFLKAFICLAIIILSINGLNSLIAKTIVSNHQPTQLSNDFKKTLHLKPADLNTIHFEYIEDGTPFHEFRFRSNLTPENIIATDGSTNWIPISLYILIIPFLLTASFFKLKESQL